MKKGVSVVVCCYNSVARLPETLRHLALQEVPPYFSWEVIVVDNASQDNTSQMALEIWQNCMTKINLRVVSEVEPGLSNARKRGVFEAKYDTIIFCDDDNHLFQNYVFEAYRIMAADKKRCVITGTGIAVTTETFPLWFEEYKAYYACHFLESDGEKHDENLVYGAGMVVRKSFLNSIYNCGYRFILSDRRGGLQTSGGDTELFYICEILNEKVQSCKQLKFFHFIDPPKLKEEYLVSLMKGVSASGAALTPYLYFLGNERMGKIKYSKDLFYKAMFVIRDLIRLLFGRANFGKKLSFMKSYYSFKGLICAGFSYYCKVKESLLALEVNIK